jgi:hypothetical protein
MLTIILLAVGFIFILCILGVILLQNAKIHFELEELNCKVEDLYAKLEVS